MIRGHLHGLRIAVATDHFSPLSSGGVERVVFEVFTRIAEMGAEVRVFTALPAGRPPFPDAQNLSVEVFPIVDMSHVVGAQVGFAPVALVGMRRRMRAFAPHVVNAHGLHFQSSLGAALARGGSPLVFTSHVASLAALGQPVRFLTSAYERTLGQIILRRSTACIAISRSVRDHLEALGVPAHRIHDIPNGVDHSTFRAAERPPATPIVMYLGRHIPNKGPQTLVEALGVLAGRGIHPRTELLSDGPLRPQLEARVRDLRLTETVVFRGHVASVAEEMRRAAILVRPSLSEGMPLGLMEAMATRLAIVASDVTGNNDLIEHERNGLLVPPNDPVGLAEALLRLLTSSDERLRLADAAARDAAKWSWDATAAMTADTLASVSRRWGGGKSTAQVD